jgi:undecaprenyl-diphosphatase
MSLLEAVVLGALQGITEFLPISSSAHLVFVPWLFGWKDPGLAFDVALHIGTLAAVLAFFAPDWLQIGKGCIEALRARDMRSPEARIGLGLVLGTLPAGIAGLLFEHHIDEVFHSAEPAVRRHANLAIAMALGGVAILLWIADRNGTHRRGIDRTRPLDLVLIGIAQAAALIPGVSRSGATITAALFREFDRETAARLSFLLSAPIMLGAGAKKGLDLVTGKVPLGDPLPFAIGFLVSGVVGFLCIRFLLRWLQSHSTLVFVWYRIALGLLLVTFALSRG